jgi:hypothetical protein
MYDMSFLRKELFFLRSYSASGKLKPRRSQVYVKPDAVITVNVVSETAGHSSKKTSHFYQTNGTPPDIIAKLSTQKFSYNKLSMAHDIKSIYLEETQKGSPSRIRRNSSDLHSQFLPKRGTQIRTRPIHILRSER